MAFRFESLEIWHRARAYATSIYKNENQHRQLYEEGEVLAKSTNAFHKTLR